MKVSFDELDWVELDEGGPLNSEFSEAVVREDCMRLRLYVVQERCSRACIDLLARLDLDELEVVLPSLAPPSPVFFLPEGPALIKTHS